MHQQLEGKTIPVDWKRFKTSDFIPTLKTKINQTRVALDKIAKNTEKPTIQNTLHAFDFAFEDLDLLSSIFGTLQGNLLTEEIKAIQNEFQELLVQFWNEVIFNEALFKRIKALHDSHPASKPNWMLDRFFIMFKREGALLGKDQKKDLAELNQRLSELSITFGNHWMTKLSEVKLIESDPKVFEGLPPEFIERAKIEGEKTGHPGKYVINFRGSAPTQILTLAKSKKLRQRALYATAQPELASKYLSPEELGHPEKAENRPVVLEIVRLREERAKLLGYSSHAEYELEERMAKTPAKVRSFLKELLEVTYKKAKKEIKDIADFAKEKYGHEKLEPWDLDFYQNLYEQEKIGFNEEELKPYFEYHATLRGSLDFIEKLYGIEFSEDKTLTTYHPEVRSFRVKDLKSKKEIGILHADPFARETKQSGAWQNTVTSQGLYSDGMRRPVVSIHFNFDPPMEGQKTQLRLREVETIMHEMGHAMHSLFSDVEIRKFAGTNVFWDFVEFPSTVMENWVSEADYLKKFAKHAKTGEVISDEWISKIKKKRTFLKGMEYLRLATFAWMDMEWHDNGAKKGETVEEFEERVRRPYSLFPDYPISLLSPRFSHLFNGGYAAGYYSYAWSEMIEADGFAFWNQDPKKRTEKAQALRDLILRQGGSEDPNILYKNWRGKESTSDAFFTKAGLK